MKTDRIWIALMDFFSVCCHQKEERSFFIKNHQFPLCARCTGIWLSSPIALITFIIGYSIKIRYCIFLMIPLIVDGTVQLLKIKHSTNMRRFITGLLYGYGSMTLKLYFLLYIVKNF